MTMGGAQMAVSPPEMPATMPATICAGRSYLAGSGGGVKARLVAANSTMIEPRAKISTSAETLRGKKGGDEHGDGQRYGQNASSA